MKAIRIIPRLDIKGPNLVKGIHLEGLRVLGKPSQFASYYYHSGADELFFQDVVASLYERNSLHHIISETAKRIFIPITVGGGLRTIEDIREVLRAGADKVCLNTAALNNPEFIKKASRIFGSSTIVIAIEAIKELDNSYKAYTDNGREYTGKDVFEWAQQVEELGAGELVITSVDKEGTGEGFDHTLINGIANLVSIPVIAHGGAGKISHVSNLLSKTDISAICLASILHYDAVKRISHETSEEEGNLEFLKSGRNFHTFTPSDIETLKYNLSDQGLQIRL